MPPKEPPKVPPRVPPKGRRRGGGVTVFMSFMKIFIPVAENLQHPQFPVVAEEIGHLPAPPLPFSVHHGKGGVHFS